MDEINDLEGQNGKTSHFCFFQKVQRFLSDNLSVLSDTVICNNVGNFWKLLKIAKNTANLIFMLWSHTPSSFYEPQTTFFIIAFLRYFWCILEKFQMVANFFKKIPKSVPIHYLNKFKNGNFERGLLILIRKSTNSAVCNSIC